MPPTLLVESNRFDFDEHCLYDCFLGLVCNSILLLRVARFVEGSCRPKLGDIVIVGEVSIGGPREASRPGCQTDLDRPMAQ